MNLIATNRHQKRMDMEITGLILAGGRGTRMGSVDKGLQPLGAQTMAQHALQRLRPQVQHLLINANQNLAAYRAFGEPVVPDAMPDFAGPLAGLQTGLMHCTTPYLVSVPCDSPLLPTDLVQRLAHALREYGAELAVAETGEGPTRQRHPVFCLLKVSLLPSLSQYLQGGGRKVEAWQASLRMATVHFDNEAAFSNINTLDELRQIEGMAGKTPAP
jgi:molybdopterin-guanine dinucleotide biosynthesis protein A